MGDDLYASRIVGAFLKLSENWGMNLGQLPWKESCKPLRMPWKRQGENPIQPLVSLSIASAVSDSPITASLPIEISAPNSLSEAIKEAESTTYCSKLKNPV